MALKKGKRKKVSDEIESVEKHKYEHTKVKAHTRRVKKKGS